MQYPTMDCKARSTTAKEMSIPRAVISYLLSSPSPISQIILGLLIRLGRFDDFLYLPQLLLGDRAERFCRKSAPSWIYFHGNRGIETHGVASLPWAGRTGLQ